MNRKDDNRVLFQTIVDLDRYVSSVKQIMNGVVLQLRPGVTVKNIAGILESNGVDLKSISVDRISRTLHIPGCELTDVEILDWLQKEQKITQPQSVISVPITTRVVSMPTARVDQAVINLAERVQATQKMIVRRIADENQDIH